MVIQIAAMSKNRAIGFGNELPWDIPEDMKFFRSTTKGKACIHGRKTFDSLKKPLPNRLNVVVSRQAVKLTATYQNLVRQAEQDINNFRSANPRSTNLPTGLIFARTLQDAVAICDEYKDIYGPDVYVCGGAEIYKQALPFTDRILLTEIAREFKGDAFFPEFSAHEFQLSQRLERSQDDLVYAFCTYDRR